jgi:fucose 4-O-acetylase-like acetyltransferase
LAFLFRAQELLRRDWMAKWTNVLRVDVLNAIGISIVMLGLVCLIRDRRKRGLVAVLVAGTISLLTPMIWTDWRPSWLPWYLESYFNGVHTFDKPQSWLFPIFPWSAFCFAGLAFAALLGSKRVVSQEPRSMKLLAVGGMLLIAAAILMDYSPIRIYSHYDFWRTSPNFFLARIGFLLLLFSICYRWASLGVGKWFFDRTVELGQHSLLVYWIHIWFVYGSFSILPHKNSSIAMATVGLIAITVFMTGLAGQSGRIKSSIRQVMASLKGKTLTAAS